ncbi:MAG: CPBP family intramembrane glutamic endopeptidase [Chthoniobacterales bacterium]
MTPFSNYLACSPVIAIRIALFLTCVLAFYGWIAWRVSRKAILKTQSFTLWDGLAAMLLMGWFLCVTITSFGKDQDITFSAVVINGVIYFFLVSGICVFLSLRHLSPIKLFGLKPSQPTKIVQKALLWLLVTYPLIMVGQGAIELLFGTNDDTQAVVTYFLTHPAFKERLAIIIMAIIVAPCAEEFLFRGYLYGVLRRFAGRIPAIIVTSTLFAAVHLHLPSMLGLGLLAVMLCLLYERTGSLWANICVHATFNSISIVMLLLLQRGWL